MGRHRPHGKRTCKMNIMMLSTTTSGSADLKRIHGASTECIGATEAGLDEFKCAVLTSISVKPRNRFTK